jgi:TolB-like protein/class 3 adenylate cyclase
MATTTATRHLAAILAADVVGYSRLMGMDEEGTHERVKTHLRELVDPKIREHHGRIVKTTGDGVLAEFASVVDAVRCAAEIQRAMADRDLDLAEERRLRFRMGVNLGDVIADGGDIYGDGVNIAVRLEGLAEPGGVCASGTVRDHVGDRLPYSFQDMGERSVKNIARPVRVYALRPEGMARIPTASASAITSHSLPIAAPRLSIVVLPFTNLSDDPKQQYFADGITEDLTTDLSRLENMFVISRNTAFTYQGKRVDTKQIGRELGVRYVLEGSVRRSDNRFRISAQLIDAETDAHLWAERFDGDTEDMFALQDEVTRRIAVALDLELIDAEVARRTEHPDALDYILQGRAAHSKPPTPDKYLETVTLFERALALDPLSVEAQCRLAITLTARVLDQMTASSGADIMRAEGLVRQALKAAPRSPLAHLAKGQGAACAETLRGSHPRIRDSNYVQSQLGECIWPSRGMQAICWVDRRDDPTHGASHSPQPPGSLYRHMVFPDWSCTSTTIAHRRRNRLARKGARCQCRITVCSLSPRLGICSQRGDRTLRH